MNKSASTLSIRLQLPSEEDTDTPVRQDEVVYLWDRIIIVSILAALVLIAVIAGAWQWLRQPEPAGPAMPVLTSQAAPPELQQATVNSDRVPPAAETPMVRANPESVAKPLPSAVTAEPRPQPPVRSTVAESGSKQQTPATATKVASATVSQASDDLAKVEILSEHLVRAQLTNDVVDREPVDHAPAVIPMNEQGLVKVYFFTEMQDLRGQTVFFDWFLEDKRMARVRARPHRDSANAYSSKFIDRHMVGQWQVKMRTEQGDALAQAEFEVR